MHILKGHIIILSACALAVFSCKEKPVVVRDTIPYVKQVAGDSLGTRLFDLVEDFDEGCSSGAIAVVGEPEQGTLLSRLLMRFDRFDNVDGRCGGDGLPDFSGEEIGVYLDEYNAPYDNIIRSGRTDYLREVAVRSFLAALDTACRVSPFDPDNLIRKAPAKVVILSSTAMSAYGLFDIDTLCRMAGKSVPVISPVHTALGKVLPEDGSTINIGVWADSSVAGARVYEEVFDEIYKPSKGLRSTLTVITPDDGADVGDRFMRFLQVYKETYPDKQLQALLIDDFGVNMTELSARLDEIRKEESYEMMNYSKILAPDFRFIYVMDAVAESCFRLMRQRSLFTHHVAYPSIHFYQTVDDGLEDENPYTVIDFNKRYLSDDTIQFIENVQN